MTTKLHCERGGFAREGPAGPGRHRGIPGSCPVLPSAWREPGVRGGRTAPAEITAAPEDASFESLRAGARVRTPSSALPNAVPNAESKKERTSRRHSLATFYSRLETRGPPRPPAAQAVLELQVAEMGRLRGRRRALRSEPGPTASFIGSPPWRCVQPGAGSWFPGTRWLCSLSLCPYPSCRSGGPLQHPPQGAGGTPFSRLLHCVVLAPKWGMRPDSNHF